MRQGLIRIRCRKQLEPKRHWNIILVEPGWSLGFQPLAEDRICLICQGLTGSYTKTAVARLRKPLTLYGKTRGCPGIELSQINLTMRADYFLKGLGTLEKILKSARQKNIRFERVGTTIGWWQHTGLA